MSNIHTLTETIETENYVPLKDMDIIINSYVDELKTAEQEGSRYKMMFDAQKNATGTLKKQIDDAEVENHILKGEIAYLKKRDDKKRNRLNDYHERKQNYLKKKIIETSYKVLGT